MADARIGALYAGALSARRTGPLYAAFPYPTKISPDVIALFVASHTVPGSTVFDGFAGSGTTGLAALLCGNPPLELQQQADQLGLNIQWGTRNAVLCELGAIGAFVAKSLVNPPLPSDFSKAGQDLLLTADKEHGWMYGTQRPQGVVRHVIWSEFLVCPHCEQSVSFWSGCVSRNPPTIAKRFACPHCAHVAPVNEAERAVELVTDGILGVSRKSRVRRPVWVYGKTGKDNWSRAVTAHDVDLLSRVDETPVPSCVPIVAIPWGDLYRRGYHQGITHLHHLYTRRNLVLFGKLWEYTDAFPERIRDALRFWLLSYNAAHATVMTRVVAKSGQRDLVLTSAQPGVLYVSGLPVEKNLILGLRRKLTTITNAFALIHGRQGHVDVRQQSSCRVDLPDDSIDYVFTDPPFGGNIPYAEVNFINEAWLGRFTDNADEVIVSRSQCKTLSDYQSLLTKALCEAHRILRKDGCATLVFHSSSADVWNALLGACTHAGFRVQQTSILDKTQASFKQTTTDGAVRGDPVLLLEKRQPKRPPSIRGETPWTVAERLRGDAERSRDGDEQTAQRLFSRFVAHYIARNERVPINAPAFYRWYAKTTSRDT